MVGTRLVVVTSGIVVLSFVDAVVATSVVAGTTMELVVERVRLVAVVTRGESLVASPSWFEVSDEQESVPRIKIRSEWHQLRNFGRGTLLEAIASTSFLFVNRINLVCQVGDHLREIR